MIKKSKEHLNSVNESYFEHMNIATNVGLKMLSGGLMAFIHGIVPGIFQTEASNKIKELYEFINKKR
jgi:hypothetical protein